MANFRSYFNKRKINFIFYAYICITINKYTIFYNIYKRFNAMFTVFFAKMRFKLVYFFKGIKLLITILNGLDRFILILCVSDKYINQLIIYI